MRCLILDDEPLAVELLADNLKQVEKIELVATCRSAAQALEVLQHETIDLIFSDIQMPGINGLQFVKSLEIRPMVIFVSAHQEYAVEGFDLDVVDYLLKPVPLERFLKACNKALSQFERRSISVPFQNNKRHLFLHADYQLVKISLDDILYIEGLKDYVKVYRKDVARPLLSRTTIKALELQLPSEHFFRTHKSYIVNLDHIQTIHKGRIKLETAEIPYSESYRDAIARMVGRVA